MKLPLRVEYIPGGNRTTGEPAWKVIEADGWPVCLCWSEDYAKRVVEAIQDQADDVT